MATLKRSGIALIVGAVLVGIAGIVGLVTGNDARFFQGCVVIFLVCGAPSAIMSGALLFGSNYPSRAAMTQLPAPGQTSDPMIRSTRRLARDSTPSIW